MKGYNKMNKQSNELINNYEKSIVLMILSCISELEINVGKLKLVSILQGSESNYIFENNFNNNPLYGLLQNYNSKQINIIIDRMLDMNLIKLKKLDLSFYSNIIVLSKQGLNALETTNLDDPKVKNEIFKNAATSLNDESNYLFQKLRNVRKEISQTLNKPAFIICTDKVLRQVAMKQPSDVDSLLSIKGIGNHFIENYSSLFLNEIELNTSI